MPRLFLIRHAEPAASWGGAESDPGLTDLGRAQAKAAARVLSGLGALEVLSSPMRRCQETAEAYVALSGREAQLEAAVSEVVAPTHVTDRPGWLRDNFRWDEGVPKRLWAEVDPALRAWRDRAVARIHAVQNDCAVFSHFIAINAIVGAAMGSAETMVFRPGHGSITELALADGALRVVSLGADMTSSDVR